MGKALLIGGSLAAITATVLALKLNSKAKAASDLKIAFGSLNIRKASFKDGVLMDVVLKATNNSTTELKFTQPFVEVSIKNTKNELAPIANSTDAEGLTVLPARKVSDLKFNLNISPVQALKIPGLLMHFVNKSIAKITGAKIADQKLLLEFGFTAEGINFKQKQDVLV